jgi:methionine synthase I (cobalamin-dependent)
VNRALRLTREVLTELTPDELTGVVAGTTGPVSRTCALLTFAPCYVVQTVVAGCLG